MGFHPGTRVSILPSVLRSTLAGLVPPKPDATVIAAIAVVALLVNAAPARLTAHEIPVTVAVQAFVKPDGNRLRVLVRVPLEAMRDVEFPLVEGTFLDLTRARSSVESAAQLWVAGGLTVYEQGRRLPDPRLAAVRVALPSERTFYSYESALAGVTGPPLDRSIRLPWTQAMLDVLLEYPIASEQSELSLRPEFARLGLTVTTSIRFLPPGGAIRAFEYAGDPGLVRLDPRWHHAALTFVRLGFLHILEGTDHLLFVLCLVIPFRRFRPLVLIVTAFTVAHSITLGAAALGLGPSALWFQPLIETLIAASIVYMALENIVFATREGGAGGLDRRWTLTFVFGLVHGFGFSFLLSDTMQFAGSHMLTSLLAFNVGVELGQILALAVFVPALHVLFRYVMAEKVGAIVVSALVAHTAWHWMTERGSGLGGFGWPAMDAVLLLTLVRWMLAAVIVAGLIWLARTLVLPRVAGEPQSPRRAGAPQR
jgi:hypothetical protein